MTMMDFGTRKVRRAWTPLILSALAVAGTLGGFAFTVTDLVRFEHDNAFKRQPTAAQRARYAPVARAEWRQVRAHLEARLDQRSPLELGAVWATRAGQVCGLVNGRGSFGGLAAMTRFYTVDQRPVFHQDVEHVAFQKAWFECRRDTYVMLHDGTMEPGFCGTELGKRRCFKVKNGVRME